ncbi:MAG: TIGR04255 family protein [Elusimicrobiota bacterium]
MNKKNNDFKTSPKFKYKVYPNSPLIEVVFEIRFPGEPSIECHRDRFYKRIRKDYPNILVPIIKEGIPLALESYRFEKKDQSSGIMVSMNKLAYYSRKYQGYNDFRNKVVKIFDLFGKLFKINKLNRVGLRYINVIPFTREEGLVPLEKFLKIKLVFPESIPNQIENLSTIFISKIKNGSITTKLESMRTPDKGREALLLDFDYAKNENLFFQKVKCYLKESRFHVHKIFEDLITTDYRKYLKGETL